MQDVGFPPSLYNYTETETNDKNYKSVVTIGSIELSGKVILKIFSRVLQQEIVQDVEFDLKNFDSLNERIKRESNLALKTNGRKGCSTDLLYSIIQKHFTDLLKKILTQKATDLAIRGQSLNDDVKNVLTGSRETILKYAKNVGEKTNDDIERKLNEMGVRPEHVDLAKQVASNWLNRSKESKM